MHDRFAAVAAVARGTRGNIARPGWMDARVRPRHPVRSIQTHAHAHAHSGFYLAHRGAHVHTQTNARARAGKTTGISRPRARAPRLINVPHNMRCVRARVHARGPQTKPCVRCGPDRSGAVGCPVPEGPPPGLLVLAGGTCTRVCVLFFFWGRNAVSLVSRDVCVMDNGQSTDY